MTKRFKKEIEILCTLKPYSLLFESKGTKDTIYVKDYLTDLIWLGINKKDLVLVFNKESKKKGIYKVLTYKTSSPNVITRNFYENISSCIIIRKATKLDIIKNMLGVL